MKAVSAHLLPDSASISKSGSMSIGGCELTSIAAEFGTPIFVYDEEHLRTRCREAVRVFGADRVIYATKAFLCMEMARLANREGLLLDVATGGELFVALSAGVPANKCVMHGNNKSVDELRMAITAGVRHIVVDNFDELDRLDELHAQGLPSPRIQLRITPGVYVHTHEFISTGQDDSKFGFNLGNGDAHKAAKRAACSASVDLVGIHCHIGSNVFAAENFARAAEIMVSLVNELGLGEVTLGGGLGVAYVTDEKAPSITEWAKQLQTATSKLAPGVIVFVEPGRSIVASAAVTLYSIGSMQSM